MKNYAGNMRKIFWYILSQRRQYIAILSLYFLTLPDARAQQIGFFTAIGTFTAFLFELPSGYIADRIGHKKTLIIAKILMLLSTTTFLLANSWYYFALASIFLNVSFAFTSGTMSAFVHESLLALKRDGDFTKIMSRIKGNASLVSAVLIIALPFFTAISMIFPFIINFFFDVFGLFVALSLVAPPQKFAQHLGSLKNTIKDFYSGVKPGFFPIAIFAALVSSFLFTITPFRAPYLDVLGLPVVLMGLTMGLSRFVWFIVARYAHLLERFTIRELFRFEVIFFPLTILLIGVFRDPYVILAIFALTYGYKYGRMAVIQSALIKRLKKREYKATALSVSMQFSYLLDSVLILAIAPFVSKSYAFAFQVLGVFSFVLLFIYYFFLPKN